MRLDESFFDRERFIVLFILIFLKTVCWPSSKGKYLLTWQFSSSAFTVSFTQGVMDVQNIQNPVHKSNDIYVDGPIRAAFLAVSAVQAFSATDFPN